MKKEKGSSPAVKRLRRKLWIISGMIGPRIFVTSDIVKKMANTTTTMNLLRVIRFTSWRTLFFRGDFQGMGKTAGLETAEGGKRECQHLDGSNFQNRQHARPVRGQPQGGNLGPWANQLRIPVPFTDIPDQLAIQLGDAALPLEDKDRGLRIDHLH